MYIFMVLTNVKSLLAASDYAGALTWGPTSPLFPLCGAS